ncbi:MAG: hypothetical protein K0R22_486 [Sporomusa sp.]|jgi:hypothetical protein|nr:hypothetical protein [Sporomusa sp.]
MSQTMGIEAALMWFLFGSFFLCRAFCLVATLQDNWKHS